MMSQLRLTSQLCKISTPNFSKMMRSIHATFEDIKAASEKKQNSFLIDVREPKELLETGKIPNSINVPLGEVENEFRNLNNEQFHQKYGVDKPDFNADIITSCRSGRRSAMAEEILRKIGYNNIRNYEGGWLEWEERHK